MDQNKTIYKLLQQLSDGAFHSGELIATRLEMTRSGVCKAMRQVEALGLTVNATSGKGYQLVGGLELLDQARITEQMTASTLATLDDLIVLLQATSTNDYLLNLTRQSHPKNMACIAEHQTQGRGRRGRSWVSRFGSGCCLSLLWHIDKELSEMGGLSLAMGVAVVNALRRYGISDNIGLKWPNDILWQGKKLAGILIEMLVESHGGCSVVIGLGLNIQAPACFQQELQSSCIANIIHTKPERNRLIGLLLNELIVALHLFSTKGLAVFLETWKQHDVMLGKPVSVLTLQQNIAGVMQGISSTGELIVKKSDGHIQHFVQGEVSLRYLA